MIELMQMIETLIDQFLLLVPSPVFVELPLLGILLANPNGRYVVAGLAVVTGFIGLWPLPHHNDIVRMLFVAHTIGARESERA